MQRRTFMAATGAAAAASVATQASAAGEKPFVDVKIDPWNQPPEMEKARYQRFIKQDDESRQDFTRGFSSFQGRNGASPEARAHEAAFIRAKGFDPGQDVDLSPEEAFNVMLQDPVFAARSRLGRANFDLHWDNPRRAFYRDADYYIGEMEKTDKSGPGRLELNPQLDMPNSTRHEIHAMPGGYVGCPFAGWTYDLGHIAGTDSLRDHGRSLNYAQAMPLPADGKVVRILDMGCGMGESSISLKERFPNTEVWGIDVGGPMVRYAHYRAVKLDKDVIFSQRDAGATGFPDGFFDIVGACIMFHEVQPEAAKKIVAEAYRVLRPGGVFHHVDIMTAGNAGYKPGNSFSAKVGTWSNHRHNVETWWPAFQETDFPGVLRTAGFSVDHGGPRVKMSKGERSAVFPCVTGTKPA